MSDHLYLGIKGHVVCIERHSGTELWRTEIKRSQLTTVVVDGDLVIAYSGGHLFGLDRVDGTIVWSNELSGLGYGYCIIASEGASSSTIAAAMQAQQQQGAAAAAAVAASSAAAASSSGGS